MSLRWPFKDPDEVLDYVFDWSPRGITGDPIASIVSTTTAGSIHVDSSLANPDGFTTTTWLSAGTVDTDCTIQLRATTTAGRVLDQTMNIAIKTR